MKPVPDHRIVIAIVDDEASVRTSLRRLCEALGLNATVYASGPQFLDALAMDPARPDCLLIDAQMPEMSGLEVCQHLIGTGERLPTLVLTADDAPEVEARYASAGVAAYMRKPIGAAELLTAIEHAVETRAKPGP